MTQTHSFNAKDHIIHRLTEGNQLLVINVIIDTLVRRIPPLDVSRNNYSHLFIEILNRVSSAKIGATINTYDIENLSTVNNILLVKKEMSDNK